MTLMQESRSVETRAGIVNSSTCNSHSCRHQLSYGTYLEQRAKLRCLIYTQLRWRLAFTISSAGTGEYNIQVNKAHIQEAQVSICSLKEQAGYPTSSPWPSAGHHAPSSHSPSH